MYYFFKVYYIRIIILEKNKQKVLPKDSKNLLSYNKVSKHFLNDHLKEEHNNLKMTAADYHKKIKVLVTGFSNGSFLIFETVEISLIHSLKLVYFNLPLIYTIIIQLLLVFQIPVLVQ